MRNFLNRLVKKIGDEAMVRKIERERGLVMRQLSKGSLYAGLDDATRQRLIRLKNEQAVHFHRRSFGALTHESMRKYLRDYLFFLQVDPDVFQGKSVAEIGSGPVAALNFCGARRIVNVDPCLSGYAKRIKNFPALATHIEWCESAGESMPLGDEEFDIVVCVNVLDHVNDPRAVVGEMRRILKGDGTLLFNVDTKDRGRFSRTVKHIGHPFWFTRAQVLELFADGFEVAYEREFPQISRITLHLRKTVCSRG